MTSTNLFTPLQAGAWHLPNRILMAPLTRCRADEHHVPTALMAEYYSQRASAGMIIAEATAVMAGCSAFGAEPGIHSDAQVAGWKQVTDAVHAKGGKIVLQLWHGGRACHPFFNDGAIPVAPSAIPITNDEIHTPTGKVAHVTPRALTDEEIPGIIAGFGTAAANAKQAGFDGVEVHAANGYLLDEFLRDGSNQRDVNYGGTIANRARLLLEVLDATNEVWGSDRVGVRISPLNSYNSMRDRDPIALSTWLATKLNDYNLAYLHVMRADFFGEQQGDIMTPIRAAYRGVLIGNMGYTAEESAQAISSGGLDAVAFGTPFLANPDLPTRFAKNAPLNPPDPTKFYSAGPEGYTDYPDLSAA
jgi:N-ethylmaleimide reductase